MKDSIRRKLQKLDERYEEIGRLLSEPDVIGRQNQFRDLSMEYSRLGPVVDRYRGFLALEEDLAGMRGGAVLRDHGDSRSFFSRFSGRLGNRACRRLRAASRRRSPL